MIPRSPILKKITLVILAIALGSVLTSGLLINYALNRQFRNYLYLAQTAREQQVVKILAQIYQEIGGWENLPSRPDLGRGMFFGNLLYVTDPNNRLVLIVRRGRMPIPNGEIQSLPIKAGNKTVGTAYFRRTMAQNLLTSQDELFRQTINSSIFWSVIITGIIAVLIAYIFARRLSAPITAMSRVARNMTNGNLKTRAEDLPRDELGELGENLNQLAERLNQVEELRKKMTADVAHDLRTPLTTVRSHLEGMIDSVIPSSRENLESLLEEVNRLISLVNDLQAIVIVDTAAQQFKKEPLQIKLFLAEAARKMTPLFREKGVLLEINEVPAVEISTDRDALAKILDNLLSNALKFTPAGKRVTITSGLSEDSLEIRIADEGNGISEKDLPYIFERFYRTDQSRNRESDGFGLGLTIVKELMTALGGTVTVSSQPGKGSIFTLTLPLA